MLAAMTSIGNRIELPPATSVIRQIPANDLLAIHRAVWELGRTKSGNSSPFAKLIGRGIWGSNQINV